MRKVKCLFLVFGLLIVTSTIAQQGDEEQSYLNRKLPSFIPPSPNAASLVRLAEASANTYTGSLDVSIPFYTISLNEMKVPVVLGYNTSGVKVEDIGSSVGLNWSLNAGGVITREVKGLPDDSPLGYQATMSFSNVGVTKVGEYVNLYVQDQLSANDRKEFEKSAAAGEFDTQPDIYSYSFPGHSGKFYITPTGKIRPLPYEPIKIEGDFSNGFTFIDTHGNKYEFKAPESTFSYTRVVNEETNTTSSPINPEVTINAWYLSKITTAYNEVVNFNYTNSTINPTYNAYQARYFLAESTFPSANCGSTSPHSKLQYTVSTSTIQQIQQKKLSKITFKDNTIDFTYGLARQDLSGDFALTNVKVSNRFGPVKSYILSYQYYSNRLFLKEVKETNQNLFIPPYVIEYVNPNELPARTSLAQDHWGFFNGALNNSSLIPAAFNDFSYGNMQTLPEVLGDANREPDEQKMKYGTISKLIYPTGGYTTFEFQPNTYSKIGPAEVRETVYTLVNNTVQVSGNTSGTPVYSNSFVIDHKQYATASYSIYGNQTSIKIVKIDPATGEEIECYARAGNYSSPQSGMDYPYLDPGTYKLRAFNYEEEFHAYINLSYKVRTNPQEVREKMGGGLRIARIEDYDPVTKKSKRQRFVYKSNLQDTYSSGVLLNTPQYDYFQTIYKLQTCPSINGTGSVSVEIPANYYVKLSAPSISLATTGGGYIGYKSTFIYNDENGENGYVKREYRTPDDYPDQEFNGFPFTQNISKDIKRGQLKREASVNVNNIVLLDKTTDYLNENYVPVYNNDWLAAGANIGCLENRPLYPDMNTYSGHRYFLYSEYVRPSLEKSIVKEVGNTELITEKRIYYDNSNHLFPTREEVINSKMEKKISYSLYPLDYLLDGSFIGQMVQKNVIDIPIEKVLSDETNGVVKIQSGTVIEYNTSIPVVPNRVFSLEISSTIPLTSYKFSNKSNGTLPFPLTGNTAFQKHNGYKETIYVSDVDQFGNVLTHQKTNDINKAYIWGYTNTYPIAEALNARHNEIFFSSCEEEGWEGLIAPQYGDLPVSAYDPAKSHTGRVAARIDKPTPGEYYSHSNQKLTISLTADAKFKLSGWVYSNGPSVDIYLFMKRQGETFYYSYVDYVTTSTTNRWVYIEKDFTVKADVKELNVRIDNNGGGTVWFDDIRLHPSNAQMTTYTHEPLVGVSSASDVNSRPTHYRFDGFGRLALVLDQDKNVLKKYCYNYQGQEENCSTGISYNTDQSRYFYSERCSGNQVPQPYYVSIPENSYYAATIEEANALAVQHGQQVANEHNLCAFQTLTLLYSKQVEPLFSVRLESLDDDNIYDFDLSYITELDYLGEVPQGHYKVTIYSPENNSDNFAFNAFGYSSVGNSCIIDDVYIEEGNTQLDVSMLQGALLRYHNGREEKFTVQLRNLETAEILVFQLNGSVEDWTLFGQAPDGLYDVTITCPSNPSGSFEIEAFGYYASGNTFYLGETYISASNFNYIYIY